MTEASKTDDEAMPATALLLQSYADKSIAEWIEILGFLFEISNEGLWCRDLRSGDSWWSPRFRELIGYPEEKHAASSEFWASLLHPDERDEVLQQIENIIDKGTTLDTRYRLMTGESEYRWFQVNLTVKRDSNDNPLLMAGRIQDITNEVATETALSQNKIELDQAERIANMGSWYRDIESDSRTWSKNVYRIFGYDPDNIAADQDPFYDSIHPDDHDLITEGISDALRGEPFDITHRIIRQDGEIRWLHELAEVTFDADGKPTKMLGTVQDITEQKIEQDEKFELEKQLRKTQKMEAIGTLSGGIAHDFNNILLPIMGYTEMVTARLPDLDETTKLMLDNISNGAKRAQQLVQQISLFSKQVEKEYMPLALNEIVVEAVQLLRASIPSTIKIELDIDKNCGMISADSSQMHQLIVNLCNNAWQAMEEKGGVLKIELKQIRASSEGSNSGSKLEPGQYACLSISDSGPGIGSEHIDSIFEPFYTTKTMEKGTGLGLSVVHGIVRSHNGEIAVETEIEVGSRFNVFFPLCADKANNSTESDQNVPRGSEGIILVDDDHDVGGVLKLMLESLGYKVDLYFNGWDALKSFEQNADSYNLIITDLTMPDMTGLELAKKIQTTHSKFPIILLTGNSNKSFDEQSNDWDINKVISKPISIMELAKNIREVLDR